MVSVQDFNKMAMARYNELEQQEKVLKTQLENVQKQIAPLKALLQGAGLIEVKKRGRRKKIVAE